MQANLSLTMKCSFELAGLKPDWTAEIKTQPFILQIMQQTWFSVSAVDWHKELSN